MDPSLWQTLGELVVLLGQLLSQLVSLGAHWVFLILWVAWWLLAVNWNKAWPVLGRGGWAPLVLLTLIAALTWSRLQPTSHEWFGIATIPNFWWQLGLTALLVAMALFCGWLQGVLNCAPPVISLEQPAQAHSDGHAHPAHH